MYYSPSNLITRGMKRRNDTDYARLGLGSVVFMTANMTNIGTDKLMALIITESLVTKD